MNEELQRIAKKDKKAFLSDQYKEIEDNNRMGKTRDLFKKIRDTKGTFQPTPVFLSGESQGQGSLVGCRLWGRTESDTTEVTYQQQQQGNISCKDGLDKGQKWYGSNRSRRY